MEKILINGFVGKDPVEKITSSGKKLVIFPVGVRSRNSSTNSEESSTNWYEVNIWNDKFSSLIPYIKKGYPVIIIGSLNPIFIYTKKDGTSAAKLSITPDSINFSASLHKKNQEQESTTEESTIFSSLSKKNEEVPF